MMKWIANISRVLVGSLFIVSGLIKANDTLGFSYKLEEYFENGALAYRVRNLFGWDTFSLEFLIDYAVAFAIVLCALEIILGFTVLFATRIKITVFSLLGLTIIFFFLTLHTATCDTSSTYTQLTIVERNSTEHQMMLNRMESNPQISVVEEENSLTFSEKMPVQCVTDCGCFGDAMKGSLGRSLTPWESFLKDLILIILIIPIVIQRHKIKMNNVREDAFILLPAFVLVGFYSWVFSWYFPLLFTAAGFVLYLLSKFFVKSVATQFIPIGIVAILSFGFIYFTYNHLPLKDYRPYAVGKNISEQMKLPEGAQPDVFENIFYYTNKKSGKVEEFTEKNYPWNDTINYVFSDRKTKLIKAGDHPAITDFTILADDGNDYAQDYLNEDGYLFMLVAYDINKTKTLKFNKINDFVEQVNTNGSYFIGLSGSMYAEVEKFRHEQQTMFDFFTCDAITLKTIIRANPGIVLLKKGTVLAKWNANDLPEFKEVKEKYLK